MPAFIPRKANPDTYFTKLIDAGFKFVGAYMPDDPTISDDMILKPNAVHLFYNDQTSTTAVGTVTGTADNLEMKARFFMAQAVGGNRLTILQNLQENKMPGLSYGAIHASGTKTALGTNALQLDFASQSFSGAEVDFDEIAESLQRQNNGSFIDLDRLKYPVADDILTTSLDRGAEKHGLQAARHRNLPAWYGQKLGPIPPEKPKAANPSAPAGQAIPAPPAQKNPHSPFAESLARLLPFRLH